eukprot:7905602-Karenia_brevis.AAC.1
MQPSQLARRVGSGSAGGHCSMRCTCWGLSLDVISFNAAISAFKKGGQPICVPLCGRVCWLKLA